MTVSPTSVSHIAFPFRWGNNGHAVELEQDTDDEIVNCVDLITSVTIGGLQDQVDFGVTDPTFTISPNPIALKHEIETWEPRAKISITFSDSGDGSELDMEVNVQTGSVNA